MGLELYIYMIQNKSCSVLLILLVSVFSAALCSSLTSHTVTIIYIYIYKKRERECVQSATQRQDRFQRPNQTIFTWKSNKQKHAQKLTPKATCISISHCKTRMYNIYIWHKVEFFKKIFNSGTSSRAAVPLLGETKMVHTGKNG